LSRCAPRPESVSVVALQGSGSHIRFACYIAEKVSHLGAPVTLWLFNSRALCDTSSNNSIIDESWLIMDFTSRQLRAFLLVAQHRNFSRAAEALFITPSVLSVLLL